MGGFYLDVCDVHESVRGTVFKIMQDKKTAGSVEQRSLAFKDFTCC